MTTQIKYDRELERQTFQKPWPLRPGAGFSTVSRPQGLWLELFVCDPRVHQDLATPIPVPHRDAVSFAGIHESCRRPVTACDLNLRADPVMKSSQSPCRFPSCRFPLGNQPLIIFGGAPTEKSVHSSCVITVLAQESIQSSLVSFSVVIALTPY